MKQQIFKIGITIYLAVLIPMIKSYGQSDFRNVTWGMTINKVKEIETASLTTEEQSLAGAKEGNRYYNGVDLYYDNIVIAERSARIYYHFTNGKLDQIRVCFKPTISVDFKQPMSKTINYFKPVFNNLEKRGFQFTLPLQCGNGRYSINSNNKNKEILSMNSWSINDTMLNLIDQMLSESKYKFCYTKLDNQRTYCEIDFASIYDDSQELCPILMVLRPQIDIKKKIFNSDF